METSVAGDVLARLPQRGRSGGDRASFPPVVRGAWRIALARRRPLPPPSAQQSRARSLSRLQHGGGRRGAPGVSERPDQNRYSAGKEAADQQRERGETPAMFTGEALRAPGGRSGASARAACGSEGFLASRSPLPFSEVLADKRGNLKNPPLFSAARGGPEASLRPGLVPRSKDGGAGRACCGRMVAKGSEDAARQERAGEKSGRRE